MVCGDGLFNLIRLLEMPDDALNLQGYARTDR
jgi:hypothetical protein